MSEPILESLDEISAEMIRLQRRLKECEQALKVIHNWASVERDKVPEYIRILVGRTLGK